jgi:FkbM family methyltransferase
MKIIHPNKSKDWFTKKLQGLVYRLDNTGNGDLSQNGELHFINSVCAKYQNLPFTFFDIGANKGEYTDLVLNEIKTHTNYSLHLFEPQKSCVADLSKKFAQNKNIRINNFGLSDQTSNAILYKDTDQSGFASVYKRDLDYYNIDMKLTEAIELKTAAEYLTAANITRINLMKIDVEGHEMKVFKGLGSFLNPTNIDFIQFEYGGANLDSHSSLREIHSLLTKKGFVVCKMMPTHLMVTPYHPRLENFMYQNWVAVSCEIAKDVNK